MNLSAIGTLRTLCTLRALRTLTIIRKARARRRPARGPSSRSSSRLATRFSRLPLCRLVAALTVGLPLASLASGPVHLQIPAPPANAVPVPGAVWRTYGTGSTGPINIVNGGGGIDQTINQTSQKAIYNWQSFDIGSASSVTFDMALVGSSALNRITGSTNPTQIFGKLSATNGGELYLINANGILFGRGAVVNTGSLIASALDVTDANFEAALLPAITATNTLDAIAFQYTGNVANFTDTQNFVQVDPGASITTTSGGRVFLFAKNVVNAGTISAPDGQVALGAGSEIFLRLPSSHPEIYATEDNAQLPVLRGLLVEVGDKYDQSTTLPADVHLGTATNALGGTISVPRGNATLVGMAVNQMGRISATTSVSENGSIFLRAEGDASVSTVNSNDPVLATKSGTLTLGPGSSTEILPDTELVNGQVPTSTDNAGFIASRIDLVGKTVELQSGAQVIAPGADMNVRAETAPTLAYTQQAQPDPDARVVLDPGAVIDLSGTLDASDSISRFFILTDLLTSNDLANAPLQKDGILYRSHVTIDVRQDSLILGDLSRYRDTIARTVDERLSTGGHIDLFAPGAVLLAAGSTIDVSGGQMTFTGATVKPTQLVSANGTVWNLNDAPADQQYVLGLNLQNANSTQYNRWGAIATPGMSTAGIVEPGYIQGQAAGSISINAPTIVEQGTLKATTLAGTRQEAGIDPLAQMGQLFLGDATGFDKYEGSQPDSASTLLNDFAITQDGPIVPELLWETPLTGDLPTASGMSVATLQDGGFGIVKISARNDVTLEAGAGLTLADHAALTLQSATGTVNLGGDITAHGGSIALLSQFGATDVGTGSHIDLSGRWINQFTDQAQEDTSATVGGSFTARGELGVALGAQSVIDVSGGAAVAQDGNSIKGGNAGAITLLAGRTDITDSASDPAAQRQLVMNGTLVADAMQGAKGGSLTLRAPSIRLGDAGEGDTAAVLTLDPAFLTQGGFSSYSLDGLAFLDVSAGTTVAPTRQAWYATDPSARYAATGSRIGDVLTLGNDPTALAPTVALTLQSSGTVDSAGEFATGGAVTLDAGSRVQLVPGSTFNATGAESVAVDGTLVDHGGNVTLKALGNGSSTQSSYVWVGGGATIDVSGATLLLPTTNGLAQGTVQDGGNVSLLATGGNNDMGASLVVQQGALIDLDGGHGALDITERTATGTAIVHEIVDGHGGMLTLATTSDLIVEGTVTARGGSATAAGGAVNVQLLGARDDFASIGGISPERAVIPDLLLQQALTDLTSGLTADALPTAAAIAANNDAGNSNATLSTQWIASTGASDVSLRAAGRLHAVGDVDLEVARNLVIDTPALAVDAGHAATLRGATTIVGNTSPPADPNESLQYVAPIAQGGTGTLTLAGTDVVLDGDLVTQGVQTLTVTATHDLQLRSTLSSNENAGTLQVAGDVALVAGQVYPATGQSYTIDTTDPADGSLHDVSISGGDANLPKPLSAGGAFTVNAATIEQGGVVRAPFGAITLTATDALTLGDGGETSVSGAGLVVAYGTTVNGATDWIAPGGSLEAPITALPGKTLSLNAGTLTTTAGAHVDLSGGGVIVAYEFIPGPGGSQDIFAGGNGAYAIVPSVQGLAPYDPTFAATYATLGEQLVIGTGAPVPAGTYTLLPARYALLPGAFLVTPVAGTPLALNTSVAGADGSTLVGARIGSANTSFASGTSSTWKVQPSAQAQTYSEVVATSADTYFARLAAQADTAAPRGAVDGGVLDVTAGAAQIAGSFDFQAAKDASGAPIGFGGVAAFSADHIVITDTTGAPVAGTLALTVQELDAMAPASLLLGASVGTAGTQGTLLDVNAQTVSFANQTPLQVADLVAAATDSVTVQAGATIVASAPSSLQATPAPFQIEGDGAALRVANVPGASLTRTGSDGLSGYMGVNDGAQLHAGAGSLTVDGSNRDVISGTAQLSGADITLAAGSVQVGPGSAPVGTLVLTDTLLAQVDNAERLTLRGYDRIQFLADTRITGGALESVTLDTPKLLSAFGNATVEAGEIDLVNTSTKDQQHGAAGPGTLTLHAESSLGSGRVVLGDGIVSIIGTQGLVLDADRAVVLDGSGTLNAGGDVLVQAPVVLALAPTGQLASVADATLSAAGTVTFQGGGTKDSATPALGAALTVDAASIVQAGDIELPSGQLTFDAASGDVAFATGSRTVVAGRTTWIDGTPIATSGGTLSATATAGNVVVAAGSTLDVSATGAATGGVLSLSAPTGSLVLDGALLGNSGNPDAGASLVLDAQTLPSLDQIAVIQSQSSRNFGGTLDVRQRGPGTLSLDAGYTLLAHQVAIDNDGGAVVLAGRIDASGGQGALIDIVARDDVDVEAGALLSVHVSGSSSSGGTVALTTTQGTLDLQAGATIDLRADGSSLDSDIQGGRLVLRAPRTGIDEDHPGGTDVAIAGIGANVQGASGVDVQAVQVFDGVTHITNDLNDTSPGTLQISTLESAEQNFLGAGGSNADTIAQRLAGSNGSVLSMLYIHPEDEVRASGDLTITTSAAASQLASDDWVLHPYSADYAATSRHAGDASITLRAAGNLIVPRTISAGFAAASFENYDDERLAAVTSGHAGEIRLVAGADLGAADAMRTNNPNGTMKIGRTDQQMNDGTDDYNVVAIRSTTGDIALAAGGDIDMSKGHTLVYTTGRDVVDTDTTAVRNSLVTQSGGAFAFDVGAGDITVNAGGSVLGSDALRDNGSGFEQAEELSSFRTLITENTAFYNNGTHQTFDGWNLQTGYPYYTGVEHGVFSFGGGDISVHAGGDVSNLVVVSPSSGFLFRAADGTAGAARIFPGGNVTIDAGRDVVNGLYESGGARLDVNAGRDFTWLAAHDDLISEPGLRLLTENGSIDANARRDATFGYVADAFYTQDQALTGLDGNSSASVQASGGNVSMLLTQELPFNGFSNDYNDFVTAQFSVAAPGGSMRIGDAEAMGLGGVELDQIPVQQSSFQLLSAGDLTVARSATFTIDVQPTADLSKGPQFVQDLNQGVPHSALDQSDRTPVHIASANGDVTLAQLITARPLRLDAGVDVILPGYVSITHQDTSTDGTTVIGETSSIQAGRDVLLEPDYRDLVTGGVAIAGPGELLVLAGRNVNLGSGVAGSSVGYVSGLVSTGNTTNGLLPAVGANITVIAGLRADGSDYTQAVRMGFAELGATGLTDHAGDLYALLMAAGNGNVALGSTQAIAFTAESTAQQLANIQTLVGAAFYDAQIANYVRSQPGQSGLSDAQALAAFAGLSATKQAAAPGVILAQAFAGQPQAQRDAFIAELAGAAGTSTYPAALLAYMEQVQGTTLTLADAIAAFEALPLVKQIPLLDRVLVAEVRTDGRAAAGASGTAQEDAYNRGYRTIAELFPVERPEGDIEMPEAAVKTLQDASITLLTPGGGIDAGGLSASTISPNNLGVVTVAGGDISAIVRDDFLVNQSRVFTLAPGDLMIWSSEGNIDAGRGAKTVVGSPPPVLRIDPVTGLLYLDTSGSFTGSGIAVLDPASTLDLYAPAGAINAGEAGIKSAGNAFFAAQTFIGTDNLTVGGHSVGAPPPVNATATVALASAGNSLAASANQVADDQKEERRKRRLRRNLLIEFLGFGPAS